MSRKLTERAQASEASSQDQYHLLLLIFWKVPIPSTFQACGMCPFIQELPFGAILFGVYESFKIPQATFIYYFVGVYELFQIDQATFICWSRQSLVGHKLLQVIIIIKLDLRNLHWICWLAVIKLGHLLVSFYSRSCTELHCNALVNSLAAPGPLAAGAGDMNWQTEMRSTTVSEEAPDL